MIKRITAALLLMSLLISSYFIPGEPAAAAEEDIRIDSSVRASSQNIRMVHGINAESILDIEAIPKGEAPKTERPPIDVVFVFDKSGSMNDIVQGKSKLEHAKEAMAAALKIFNENNKPRTVKDRFAFVAFDSGVNPDNSQFTLNSDTSGIASKVSAIKAEGGTNYTNSLEKARMILESGKGSDARNQYILFMTDGKPTNSEKTEQTNKRYLELIEENEYISKYGYYWSGLGKYWSGNVTTFKDKTYMIGDSNNRTVQISGAKKMHFDTNPGRNYIIVEHNGKYYIERSTASAVQEEINKHITDQAKVIKEKNIILNSIGFGESSQVDMKLLEDISSQAKNATDGGIVEIYQELSKKWSSPTPILSDVQIQFNLPDGAVLRNAADAVLLKNGKYKISLPDVLYNPLPAFQDPKMKDPRKYTAQLPIVFTKPGEYTINMEVVYTKDNAEFKKPIAPVTVKVEEVKLEKAVFKPIEVKVGETVVLNDKIEYFPADATYREIRQMQKGPSNAFELTFENGQFKAKGINPGFNTIQATVVSGSEQITANGTIQVVSSGNDQLKW
ncbi:VWA domain-containing protein [Bacillus mangrovi]|uniref:VWA domain-containing protein n=1 Tax=Metabacillus mangrovi TaxID=1491830 RepID=A0A7X2S488_9BACI|nr:VWA domain-containing protein [Metabacillus mangrovi]MTH52960.1 VWA domain-containing protein [Metabacillus mangrovi]